MKVLFGTGLFAVDVYDVGDVLEGVEADSDWEDYVLDSQSRMEERIYIFGAESPVFEEYQPPEVKDYANGQP